MTTLRIGRILGSFHHRAARSLAGMQPRILKEMIWDYPTLEDVLRVAGLETMETYIYRFQNTVVQ